MSKNDISKLQNEIELLKSDIELLNKKLSESEKYRTHFISNVMNEIYNPFTSILMMASNISKLNDGELDKAKSMANAIHSEAFKLDFHLKNIFAAAMIEAGLDDIDSSNTDINQLIQSIIDSFEIEIKTKQIHINYQFDGPEEALFYCDSKKLSLIFSNLISNAIKYNKSNGEVHINAKLENDKLVFKIKDEGSGIQSHKEKEIFDRFKRLDETINSVSGGNGLGLSVVKAYNDLLEGEINLRNKGGLEITVIIPQSDEIIDDENFFEEDELF